jgi:hypothetical protein
MKNRVIRQGDVLLVPIKVLPKSVVPMDAESGRVILARGEATGHHHSFAMSERVALFREDGSGGGLFLSVTGAPAALEHQEHSALDIPPGKYEVRGQREYHPAEIRRVVD